MKAICENELVIDCAGYKALDSGVVLTGDEDRSEVIAFVPNEKLEYLLPDDVAEREHERLGLPAPELTSPDDLEERLDAFVEELDALREALDQQVEELVDEDATGEEEFERQDRLYERRRTIDRLLQQVEQRARQLGQLSTVESGSEEHPTTTAEGRASEEPGTGLTERVETLERQLQELAAAVDEEVAGPSAAEDPNLDDVSIRGLGSTYRRRLHDAGIDTVGDLAERSPEEVADAANASASRAESWIEIAEEFLENRQLAA
jgi:predicted flap endonuclease-1-like 5' DNA nuclease